jgi:hypothetical protein
VRLILAAIVVLFLVVLSQCSQGLWFVASNLPKSETHDLAKSELRQTIFDCRAKHLAAGVDVPADKREQLRRACALLELEYRRRFGEPVP